MRRRWLALGILLLAIGGSLAYGLMDDEYAFLRRSADSFVFGRHLEPPQTPDGLAEQAFVTLERRFVCGMEEQSLGMMTKDEIAALAQEHADWEFAAADAQTVRFTEYVNDLSEQCKLNSYFGLDREGNLTLFEGPPKEEKVVRTFFQLDIEHLESALPETVVRQLKEGIRVTDLAEYNSVLSTFSDFAVEDTEKVMKPE